mmetsp:Transcript_120541/g.384919  ORF Transcript_120541/g.384919 Transcript_120541/m.384919 type:complete len:177 (-) Transcript_120541:58-588(-)
MAERGDEAALLAVAEERAVRCERGSECLKNMPSSHASRLIDNALTTRLALCPGCRLSKTARPTNTEAAASTRAATEVGDARAKPSSHASRLIDNALTTRLALCPGCRLSKTARPTNTEVAASTRAATEVGDARAKPGVTSPKVTELSATGLRGPVGTTTREDLESVRWAARTATKC